MRLRRRPALCLAAAAAALGAATAVPAASTPTRSFTAPITAIPAADHSLSSAPTYLLAAAQSEPRVLVDRDGTVLVSAQFQPRDCVTGAPKDRPREDCVWRSEDNGRSFRVSGGGTNTGSDVEFVRLPSGTLLYATLANIGLGSGVGGVAVLRSTDGGGTWSSSVLNGTMPIVDREWLLAVGDELLLVFTAPPGNVFVSRSTDDGRTFSAAEPVTAVPPRAGFSIPGSPSYDAVRREVVLPYEGSPEGEPVGAQRATLTGRTQMFVARSRDVGRTWTTERVATYRFGQGVISSAADSHGREVIVYPGLDDAGRQRIYVTRNLGAGSPWTAPQALSEPGHLGFLPWVVARGDGGIAAAWVDTVATQPSGRHEWGIRLGLSDDFGDSWRYRTLSVGPVYTGSQFDSVPVLFDLFGLSLDRSGRLHLAWPRQVNASAAPNLTEVQYVRQSSGPGLGQ